MDESINNIYFLKETIGKFKTELQKFISNPSQQKNNIISLRQNIEDLEKKITKKEKSIAHQILNNNLGTFIPIASRITNKNQSSSLNKANTMKKFNSTSNGRNFIINNSNINSNCYNNLKNTEEIKNKTFTILNNNMTSNAFQKNITVYGNANFANINNTNMLNEDFSNSNRNDIIPNINYVPESYYDLAYRAKKKEILSEYSTPQLSNGYFLQSTGSKSPKTEKDNFKITLLTRRPKDSLHNNVIKLEEKFQNKQLNEKLMERHNLQTNNKVKFHKIQRNVGTVNYMDKSKINKFSHHNKNLFSAVNYDKNMMPVITQDEINKGILSMINRGLIPKTADLTPAFNRNGHPITLSKGEALKDLYTKTKLRDEVELEGNLEKIKYNFANVADNLFITSALNENQSMRDFINLNNVFYNNSASYENDTKDVVKTIPNSDVNNLIKKTDNEMIEKEGGNNFEHKKILNYINENDMIKSNYINEKDLSMGANLDSDKDEQDKNNLSSAIKNIDDSPFVKKVIYTVKMLIFKNFKLIENEHYYNLIQENEEKLGQVIYLIEHFCKLFRKLNINYAEVEFAKFLALVNDELKNITNKDLIFCLTEKDFKAKGFDNNKTLHINLKEAYVVRIQKFYRMHLAKINYHELKSKVHRIKRLQRNYRLYRIYKLSKSMIEEKRIQKLVEWKLMMNQFKNNWNEIKKGPRIEIHLNSLSFSFLRNCTIEKFSAKENNQLNRLINLIDPNVEIIYIAPFKLENEVLSYYFSILSTLGVENAKERFHLIVPEEISYFAPCFSLTQMLLFSCMSLNRIKNVIKGKNSFIVPGVVSKYDVTLSMYLECPILMDEFEITKTLFSKSGSKRVFELTNMAFPISAWDIRSEEEFYNSLIDLITKYLTVNIWIFKMDSEVNGRGIAYIQLDKIKAFLELRKERQSGIIDEENFQGELRMILQKCIPKKSEIVTPNLYKNFKHFLREFCENQGIIESCPTSSLSGITGSPAISMFIEPDGNIEYIGTYDKINHNCFRNIAAISPQISIPNLNTDLIVDRLGKYLFKQGILGYITIEYITFLDGSKILFWAIDLKFGYSDIISCIKFSEALDAYSSNMLPGNVQNSVSQSNNLINTNSHNFNNHISNSNYSKQSSNLLSRNDSSLSINLKNNLECQNKFKFILPVIIHSEIANLKMRDLVQMFRNELLVYDLEKRNGIVFNLPDIIQCGMFGICGIARNKDECFKLFESSINLLKNIVNRKDNKNISLSIENRSDIIDVNDLIGRIKYYLKNFK